MTLSVPLTVRVGDHHITQQVQALSFRKEAIGGVRSISFNLARPLADLAGLDPLAMVYVYDSRSAEPVAQGRLSDTGRSASGGGQAWGCVAFGPIQHASDFSAPKIYIDRSVSDGWSVVDIVHPEATIGAGTRPDGGTNPTQGVLSNWPSGIGVNTNSRVVYLYDRVWQSGDRLAWFEGNVICGINSVGGWAVEVNVGNDGSLSATASGPWMSTAAQDVSASLLGSSYNTLALRSIWYGGAATTTGDDTWAHFYDVAIETLRHERDGTAISAGYVGTTVTWAIVDDLLGGGRLPDFDGANATVAASSGVVDRLAYPDGVNCEQVLADLMEIDPAYRWYTYPDTTGEGYGFTWGLWPTTVRYEATLDDGADFPLSTRDVWNSVVVRYTDPLGRTRHVWRTLACQILDDAGLTRTTTIDLGSEAGTNDQAIAAGDAFLEAHNVPKNGGTLNVARPIRDVITGAMVQPWEIEAGELVRVLGVEAYPDAFNADTNDGQGVFRIHALDYNSDGNVAVLALDADPRETEDALVQLMNQRTRR